MAGLLRERSREPDTPTPPENTRPSGPIKQPPTDGVLDGVSIQIPAGHFVVAEVCAGLRFLLATLSIGVLYAYVANQRWWSITAIGLLSMLFAIVFNWFRVVTIILAGHVFGMDFWLVRDHITFGWVVFVIGLVPLVFSPTATS